MDAIGTIRVQRESGCELRFVGRLRMEVDLVGNDVHLRRRHRPPIDLFEQILRVGHPEWVVRVRQDEDLRARRDALIRLLDVVQREPERVGLGRRDRERYEFGPSAIREAPFEALPAGSGDDHGIAGVTKRER